MPKLKKKINYSILIKKTNKKKKTKLVQDSILKLSFSSILKLSFFQKNI